MTPLAFDWIRVAKKPVPPAHQSPVKGTTAVLCDLIADESMIAATEVSFSSLLYRNVC